MHSLKIILPLLALMLSTLCSSYLRAAGVITNCNEASLLLALEGGGITIFECDGTIFLTNTISISENTVLDGNGHSVNISGGGSNRVFHVQTNVQFALNGLSIVDGFSTNGGGLYNDGGVVLVTNCSFLRNKAVGKNGSYTYGPNGYKEVIPGDIGAGGALFNAGSLMVYGSTFEDNQAVGGKGGEDSFWRSAPGGEGSGAAILNLGVAAIFETVLEGNVARGGAGGDQLSSVSGGGGNGGSSAGSAICNYADLSLTNSILHLNASIGGDGGRGRFGGAGGEAFGGAICNRGGNIYGASIEFLSNRSEGGGGGTKWGAYGGACFNDENGFSGFTNCSFLGNTALGVSSGGACYNKTGFIQIDSCNIISNSAKTASTIGAAHPTAPVNGGGIYNADRLQMVGSFLRDNSVHGGDGVTFHFFGGGLGEQPGGDAQGGGLFNSGQTQISNCILSANAAYGGKGSSTTGYAANGKAVGGGIANYGQLTILESDVTENLLAGTRVGGAAGIFSTNVLNSANNTVVSNVLTLQIRLVVGSTNTGLPYSPHAPSIRVRSDVFFLVTGEGLAEAGYEWFSPGTNRIDGKVGRSYTLDDFQTNEAGVYFVRFEDNIGNTKTLSASVAPGVISAPEDQTKNPGESVTFTVGATGSPLNYQWAFNSVPIPGATGSGYTFTAQLTNIGVYTVVVSNPAGTVSASAALNMPPVITVPPGNQFAAPGERVAFEVTAGGTAPFSYQWRFNGEDIPGATNSNYMISSVSGTHNGTYSVVVSNEFDSAISAAATLTLFNIIHWQKSDGSLAMWKFEGTNFVESTLVGEPTGANPAWRMIGLNDFNEDGQIDYLWRKTNGILAVWFMNQTNRIGSVLLRNGQPVPPAWRFVGFGDFNHDTKKDILWQNADRRLAAWFMEGTNVLGSGLLREGEPAGPSWRAMGAHDFDHDENADVLLQHDDGRLAIWTMNQTNRVSVNVLRNGKPAAAGWRVAGLSDFNDDGDKDILMRNKDGRLAVWFLDEMDFVDVELLRNGPAAIWRSVGVR